MFPQASTRMGPRTPVSHPSNVDNQRQRSRPPVPDHQFALGFPVTTDNLINGVPGRLGAQGRSTNHLYPQEDQTLDSAFTNERTVLYLVRWPDLPSKARSASESDSSWAKSNRHRESVTLKNNWLLFSLGMSENRCVHQRSKGMTESYTLTSAGLRGLSSEIESGLCIRSAHGALDWRSSWSK